MKDQTEPRGSIILEVMTKARVLIINVHKNMGHVKNVLSPVIEGIGSIILFPELEWYSGQVTKN